MTEIARAGDRLPSITLPDLEGAPVVVTEPTGRPLIIFMWASW